jgi:hypothetical protein
MTPDETRRPVINDLLAASQSPTVRVRPLTMAEEVLEARRAQRIRQAVLDTWAAIRASRPAGSREP